MEETEEKPSAGLDELPPAYITVSAGVPMVRSRDELGVKPKKNNILKSNSLI